MSFLSYPVSNLHCSLHLIRCCFPSLPHSSSLLPSPFLLLWLLCLLIVPTANNCDAIPDSLTREDNPLTVHFSSLGIVTVPSSPIRPREAGPSEAPQLVLACQTTLNIENIYHHKQESGKNDPHVSDFETRVYFSFL